MTSLADSALAAPIVDALNQISALATVPLSIHDLRGRRVANYPRKHLVALTDRTSRADLLSGAHSLWYEYTCLQLHQSLADLDEALTPVPEPVRIAVGAELETEAGQLTEALADFSGEAHLPETEGRREWDFGHPFVTYDGGVETLGRETREQLDLLEEGITTEEREKAIADLRVLATACSRFSGESVMLDHAYPRIFAEPYDADGYYLSIHAPEPGDGSDDSWDIDISRWQPDDPNESYEECSSATGGTVLRCALPAAPTADEIVDLLNRVDREPDLLIKWAETSVGELVAGHFVVTKRYDD
ncbi:hypothetical protein OG194_20570 [Streptomyces sp. NBC_01288]|uniref:hypothetical protein n=1 Tax=Streptomyces sp. NBC_01288 TaxID=2903814 RepID=UPI002E0DB792|nr:hypothetical protein OG194_20570 [Streptomyces sp. NBC_01288]